MKGTALAAELGLLITGSSDYHGAGKPNRLGENTHDAGGARADHRAGNLRCAGHGSMSEASQGELPGMPQRLFSAA